MRKLTTETAPVRVVDLPAARRATTEAVAHLRRAPLPQRWNLTPKAARA